MTKGKLYKEKVKKKTAQKTDKNGLGIVPNYEKKLNKKATHNTKQLSQMDVSWQAPMR